MELAFEEDKHKVSGFMPCGFNPSYRGIGFWSFDGINDDQLKIFVSILLIVELAFEGFIGLMDFSGLLLFQSFLSWNWLLKHKFWFFGLQCERVSILLIVELAFEGVHNYLTVSTNVRFNPSYRGIGFWSNIVGRWVIHLFLFQSFLSWNWLLKSNWF